MYFIAAALRSDSPVISDMRVSSDMDSARFAQLTLATEYGPDHYIPIYCVDTTEESADWESDEIFDYFKTELFDTCEKLEVISTSMMWGMNKKPKVEIEEASIAEIVAIMEKLENADHDPLNVISLAVEKYKSAHSL